jgi:hypothetical protein
LEESVANPRNERNQAVTKFCLAMEDHRRTEAGRVRTAKEFVTQFFPYDEGKANDRLFLHLPNEVRGPVLAKWGIRGAKAALKDDHERVKLVVHDALIAGDIDETIFEEGVTAAILIDWVSLGEWWSFWRQGRLTGGAIQKALATARELGLIDDAWFLLNLQGRGGKLKGTDVLCDTLSKDQIVAWLRKMHETGDGSPAGVIAAIGWPTVLAKTAQDALLFALDQFARKAGLVPAEPEVKAPAAASKAAATTTNAATTTSVATTTNAATLARPTADPPPPSAEPSTARHAQLAEAHPTVSAPVDAAAMAETEALADVQARAAKETPALDSGLTVAIPDIPAVDAGTPESAASGADATPTPPGAEEHSLWATGPVEESPKLAEAREAVMQTLMSSSSAVDVKHGQHESSDIPVHPSSLDWSDPAPITGNGASVDEEPIALDESDLQGASVPKLRAVSVPPPIPKKGPPPRTS